MNFNLDAHTHTPLTKFLNTPLTGLYVRMYVCMYIRQTIDTCRDIAYVVER